MSACNKIGDFLAGSFIAQIGKHCPRVEYEGFWLARHQRSFSRFFSVASAASKLLPLYFARKF